MSSHLYDLWGIPNSTHLLIFINLTHVPSGIGARYIRRDINRGMEKNHFIHTKNSEGLHSLSQHWDKIIWSKTSITSQASDSECKLHLPRYQGFALFYLGVLGVGKESGGGRGGRTLFQHVSWAKHQGYKGKKMEVQEVVPLRVYHIFESNSYSLSQSKGRMFWQCSHSVSFFIQTFT